MSNEAGSPELAAEVELISAERLTFFSDAVVAIAMTLLALELPVPVGETSGEVLNSINANFDEYLAFLISFAVIAAHWRGHHRTFRYVKSVNHIVRWNILWLLWIVVTPFATRVLTQDGAFQFRFMFYASVQALAGLSFLLMLYGIAHYRLLKAGTPPGMIRDTAIGLSAMTAMFLISIPIALVTHWAYLCWVAIPPASRVVARVADRYFPQAGAASAS